jgi:hypothetical protein
LDENAGRRSKTAPIAKSAVPLRLQGFLGTTDDFEWALQINLLAAVRAIRAALAPMLERTTSSTGAHQDHLERRHGFFGGIPNGASAHFERRVSLVIRRLTLDGRW